MLSESSQLPQARVVHFLSWLRLSLIYSKNYEPRETEKGTEPSKILDMISLSLSLCVRANHCWWTQNKEKSRYTSLRSGGGIWSERTETFPLAELALSFRTGCSDQFFENPSNCCCCCSRERLVRFFRLLKSVEHEVRGVERDKQTLVWRGTLYTLQQREDKVEGRKEALVREERIWMW